jgi:hypothetical protein
MTRTSLLAPAWLLAAALTVSATGCDTSESFSPSPCDVSLRSLEPGQAWVGDRVDLTGRPFTSAYDTAVYVGSERATILSIAREGCEACDDCLDDEGCSGCDDCDACDPLCDQCIETVAFVVPQVEAGPAAVQLFNRHGESDELELEVLSIPEDTAPGDSDQDSSPPDDTDDSTAPDSTVDSHADSAPDTDARDSG